MWALLHELAAKARDALKMRLLLNRVTLKKNIHQPQGASQ
jgi:hypothetical protein